MFPSGSMLKCPFNAAHPLPPNPSLTGLKTQKGRGEYYINFNPFLFE